MGMTAAIKLKKVMQNATNVLAIEAMAAAQALDLRAPLRSSARCEKAKAAIRNVSPPVPQDRVLAGDFAALAALIESGDVARALE